MTTTTETVKVKVEAPSTALLFASGNTSCFDNIGQQVGELQKSWMSIWLEWMESKGVNPMEIDKIEIFVHGKPVRVKPFKIASGEWKWNLLFENE